MGCTHQAPLSMGFSRQECWSRLPFPFPGDLPDSGIESLSPAWHVDSLPSETSGKPSARWPRALQWMVGHDAFGRWWLWAEPLDSTTSVSPGRGWPLIKANPWHVAWFSGSAERDLA